MVCLGFKPGVAGWKAQTNPLSYGGIPGTSFLPCHQSSINSYAATYSATFCTGLSLLLTVPPFALASHCYLQCHLLHWPVTATRYINSYGVTSRGIKTLFISIVTRKNVYKSCPKMISLEK